MHSTPNAISHRFAFRFREDRKVLIPYLTAGYPDSETSLGVMEVLAEAGGDILELGIPFSDPLADGPTIQRSSFRALEQGMTVAGVLELLERFRKGHDQPVVLFTYLNPVLRYGLESFLSDALEAGAQGLLLTDLPTGADPELEELLVASELDLIRLLAPTTTRKRMSGVAGGGSGFLYYISRTGVTGAQQDLRGTLAQEVAVVREEVGLPVAVGFGISTPRQASTVAAAADGVVVGSALIDALDEGGVSGAGKLLAALRAGMDGGE
jgi:tryptophan synthase alpha chain